MLKDYKSVLEGIRSVLPGGPKGAATTRMRDGRLVFRRRVHFGQFS
jgi:hypothetical protein